jgi:hypothetical protein
MCCITKRSLAMGLVCLFTTVHTIGCGPVAKTVVPKLAEKIAPTLQKSSRFTLRNGDDLANAASKAKATQGTANSLIAPVSNAAARMLLVQVNKAKEDFDKESKIYEKKKSKLHREDQSIMEQRLTEHRKIFSELTTALQSPENLPSDAPKRITDFLAEHRTDTKQIQELLNQL